MQAPKRRGEDRHRASNQNVLLFAFRGGWHEGGLPAGSLRLLPGGPRREPSGYASAYGGQMVTKNECPGTPVSTSQQSSGGGLGTSATAKGADNWITKPSAAPTLSTVKRRRESRMGHLRDARLLTQRPPRRIITQDFMTVWRGIEDPLRCYLGAMGLARHDIDDITQETVTRALEAGIVANDPGALRPWAFVVAKRLALDLFRARRRWVEIDEAQGPDADQEVALRRVEERHLLRTVASKVAVLPLRERDSFRAAMAARTPAERNRAAVARHRARRRLRYLVGPLAVAIAWIRRQGPRMSVSGALAAAVMPLAVLTVYLHGQPAKPGNALGWVPPAVERADLIVHQIPARSPHPPTNRYPTYRAVERISTPTTTGKIVLSAGRTDGSGVGVAISHHPPPPRHHLLCIGGSDFSKPMCIDVPGHGGDGESSR